MPPWPDQTGDLLPYASIHYDNPYHVVLSLFTYLNPLLSRDWTEEDKICELFNFVYLVYSHMMKVY